MKRVLIRAAMLAAGLATSLAASTARADEAALRARSQPLLAALDGARLGACDGDLAANLASVTGDPDFDRLAADQRETLLFAQFGCLQRADDRPAIAATARRLLGVATRPEVRSQAALALMIDASRRNAPADMAANAQIVLETTPERLAQAPPKLFDWGLSGLTADRAASAAFVSVLRRAPWTTEDAHQAVDNGWALQEATFAAEAGDMTRAAAVLSRATQLPTLMAVYQDRRFEPLWPEMAAAGRFDWRALETTRLAGIDERIRREPRRLELVVERIKALNNLQRYDEARAVGADYVARMKRKDAFDDLEDQKAWVLYAYANVLSALGETAPADGALAAGADGQDKISQNVNRAALQLTLGHPAQALEAIEKVPPGYGTAYGRMVVASSKLCALAQLDRRPEAEAELAGLRSNWRDNPSAALQGLACLEQDDEAAAVLVRWLQDPTLRGGALAWFRHGAPSPAAKAAEAMRPAFLRRQSALKTRPEVQAALAKVGRSLAVDLGGDYGA
ncbi:hypothetical protein [Caulobacter hibisci]|uniref:Uncharacterized protein n=1 Tax=Caulobacter hibisci TaxID=2035993 RepID=A0ABS0T4L8_9CAUL|nr:hypothetical protein [Caulobacter hibisci]MBI1686824.1 hypothetical protein [Caulobacter hibisci]